MEVDARRHGTLELHRGVEREAQLLLTRDGGGVGAVGSVEDQELRALAARLGAVEQVDSR